MEDNIVLSGAVRARLGWPLVRSPAPPERVEFEELCATWAKHGSVTPDPPLPPLAEGSTEQTRSSGSSSLTVPLDLSSRAASMQSRAPSVTEQCVDTAALISVEPYERVSRTFRCFVSWKAP